MTPAEFAAISVALPGEGGRTHRAAYLVLVDGLTLGQASRQVDVNKSAVSKLCARMRLLAQQGCPTCGAPLNTARTGVPGVRAAILGGLPTLRGTR